MTDPTTRIAADLARLTDAARQMADDVRADQLSPFNLTLHDATRLCDSLRRNNSGAKTLEPDLLSAIAALEALAEELKAFKERLTQKS